MSRFSRLVSVFALLSGPVLMAGMSTASADDTYGASIAVSVEVKVDTTCGSHCAAKVSGRVQSDTTARTATRASGAPAARAGTHGDLVVSVDGKQVKSIPISDEKWHSFKISCDALSDGSHTAAGRFVPAANSAYQSGSASKKFTVACHKKPAARDNSGDSGGLLPTTGGPWIGLLILGLILLAIGTYLARRSKKA
jgi:LPXTG-motif cell wall-anchored protein